MLTQEQGKTMGIVCVYLAEILLELTLRPISTRAANELLRERSPFPRAGHIYSESDLNKIFLDDFCFVLAWTVTYKTTKRYSKDFEKSYVTVQNPKKQIMSMLAFLVMYHKWSNLWLITFKLL